MNKQLSVVITQLLTTKVNKTLNPQASDEKSNPQAPVSRRMAISGKLLSHSFKITSNLKWLKANLMFRKSENIFVEYQGNFG